MNNCLLFVFLGLAFASPIICAANYTCNPTGGSYFVCELPACNLTAGPCKFSGILCCTTSGSNPGTSIGKYAVGYEFRATDLGNCQVEGDVFLKQDGSQVNETGSIQYISGSSGGGSCTPSYDSVGHCKGCAGGTSLPSAARCPYNYTMLVESLKVAYFKSYPSKCLTPSSPPEYFLPPITPTAPTSTSSPLSPSPSPKSSSAFFITPTVALVVLGMIAPILL